MDCSKQQSILLVDDHDLVLQGLKRIIESSLPEISVVCTANTGQEALAQIELMRFDAYMLDIELPDINGLELVKLIRAKHPDSRIIINTVHEEIWFIKDIMRHNINGVLFKSIDSEKVTDAIRQVIAGGTYYCRNAERARRKIGMRTGVLSSREIDVLKHISDGKSTSEIATELCLSVNTVETHRRHLLDKLGARNVADLVMTAVSEGIIPLRKKD